MEACLATSWVHARPLVNATPSDLEWWIAGAAPGTDFGRLVRLWSDGPDVLAYGWLSPPGSIDWHQRRTARPANPPETSGQGKASEGP